MIVLLKKFFPCLMISILLTTTSSASSQTSPERKVYTTKERRAKEALIRKDIEESLDWQKRDPLTLDDLSDSERWLYGRFNESVLLRKSTGERFGIFEIFDDTDNTIIFEIRLHKKNILTNRFSSVYDSCKLETIAAEIVTSHYVLYREGCSYPDKTDSDTLYLYDYASNGLYWIYTAGLTTDKDPTVEFKNGIYKVRWNIHVVGSKKPEVVIRNFKIYKDKNGKWEVKNLPPINDETGVVMPMEKLPIKPEYNLPDFVAKWGKN